MTHRITKPFRVVQGRVVIPVGAVVESTPCQHVANAFNIQFGNLEIRAVPASFMELIPQTPQPKAT